MPGIVPTKHAVVTGARGFLGRRVCLALKGDGWAVRGLGRGPKPLGLSYEYDQCPAMDEQTLYRQFHGVGAVVHCAGLAHQHGRTPTRAEFFEANASLTASVARAAVRAGVRRLLVVSSSSVYGPGHVGSNENDRPTPDTPYGESKLEGERLATEIVGVSKATRLIVLRPSTLFGPGDPGNIGRLARAIASHRFIGIGSGDNEKSWTLADDVAAVIARLASRGFTNPAATYNCSAPPTTLRDACTAIADSLGIRRPAWIFPATPIRLTLQALSRLSLGFGPAPRIAQAIDKWISTDTLSAARLEQDFGPIEWTSFSDGIALQLHSRISPSLTQSIAA